MPAWALRLTCVPWAKFALHVNPQLIPGGELDTLPLPLTLTDSASAGAKVAVTDSALLIVTVQLPLPEQTPPQLLKTQPAGGGGG